MLADGAGGPAPINREERNLDGPQEDQEAASSHGQLLPCNTQASFINAFMPVARFGSFDSVWALEDAINYLMGVDELTAAPVGMRGIPP